MKLSKEMMDELCADDAVEKQDEEKELRKLSDIEVAIQIQSRILEKHFAEMMSCMEKKYQYKFTVKRDDNKLITEIIATPIGVS